MLKTEAVDVDTDAASSEWSSQCSESSDHFKNFCEDIFGKERHPFFDYVS